MPRTKRPRAADVKLPKTWGKVRPVKDGFEFDVMPVAELRRRLRDVAEAAGMREWKASAQSWEAAFDRAINRYEAEYALYAAIAYRGILSLCEVE